MLDSLVCLENEPFLVGGLVAQVPEFTDSYICICFEETGISHTD